MIEIMPRVAVGLLFDTNGRILIAQRNRLKRYGGTWEFPGGKLESGETVEAALAREILEELAAPIMLRQTLPGYVYVHDELAAYFTPVIGRIHPQDIILKEHEACRFVSTGELATVNLSPYDFGALGLLTRTASITSGIWPARKPSTIG